MTLRLIEIFIEVVRQQSVTKASKRLHMAQPAVSRAIKEIEGEYGVPLFERIGRRLFITSAGRAMYGKALRIAESFDALEQQMTDWSERGTIRIGAGVALGSYLLPALAALIEKRFPETEVTALVANGGALRQALTDNSVDIALMEGDVSGPLFGCEQFGEDRLMLILPPDHKLLKEKEITLARAAENRMLLRERGSGVRDLVDSALRVRGISVKPAWESASTEALINAVARGLGISVLPHAPVASAAAAGEVCERELADEPFRRAVSAVWRKDKLFTPAMEAVAPLCSELWAEYGSVPQV